MGGFAGFSCSDYTLYSWILEYLLYSNTYVYLEVAYLFQGKILGKTYFWKIFITILTNQTSKYYSKILTSQKFNRGDLKIRIYCNLSRKSRIVKPSNKPNTFTRCYQIQVKSRISVRFWSSGYIWIAARRFFY